MKGLYSMSNLGTLDTESMHKNGLNQTQSQEFHMNHRIQTENQDH